METNRYELEIRAIKKKYLNKLENDFDNLTNEDAMAILKEFGEIDPYIFHVKTSDVYESILDHRDHYRHRLYTLDCIVEMLWDEMHEDYTEEEIEKEIRIVIKEFASNKCKGFQYDW